MSTIGKPLVVHVYIEGLGHTRSYCVDVVQVGGEGVLLVAYRPGDDRAELRYSLIEYSALAEHFVATLEDGN